MKKNKKLLTLAITSVLLAGGGAIVNNSYKVNAEEPDQGVLALFNDYYNSGSYRRDTTINFNKENGAYDVAVYFHAKADDLERTTYFNGDELWMTNSNGVNSGYGTDGNNMTHFCKDLKTGENISVYTAVKNTTMEDYYQTLFDFSSATYDGEWTLNNNVYASNDKTLINQFGLFTAPCFLGFEGDTENLLTFSHVEVEEVNDTLEMRLYVKEDSKGWLQDQEELLFSKAVISKGGEIEKVKPELNYHYTHNQEIGIETIRDNFNSLFSVTPSSVEYTYKFIEEETFEECSLENLLVGCSYYLEIFAEETIKQEAGEYSGNKLLNGRLFTVTEGKPTITYSNFQGTYEEGGVQFTPDKLLDGSLETCAWFTSAPTNDSYILVDLLKPQLIESITVYNGNRTSGDAGDLTLYGSKDNTSYKVLGYVRIGEDGTDCTVNLLEPGSYRYIKVADIDSGGNWFALRELNINTTDKVATYNDFDGIHQGDLKNIIDGDESSYVWLSGSPKASSCVMIELNEVIELKDLTILQGTEGNTDSLIGKVEVSEDGTNWNYVGEITVENQLEAVFDIHKNPLNVKYIKLTHNGSRSNWVIIREILVNTMIHRDFTYENIDGLFSEGVLENAYDGNYDTYAWFDYNNKADASFTLDLGEVKEINNIDVVMGQHDEHNDYFHNYELLVSDDGTTWDKLGEYKDTRVLKLDLEESITIRYVKVHALALDLDNNIVIREIAAYFEKVDPEITFSFESGQSFEYDGTGEAPNISVSVPEGVEYTWAYVDNGTPIGDGHTIPTTPGSYALDITTLANETYNAVHTWRVFHITAPVSEEVIIVEPVFDNEGTYNVNNQVKAPTLTGFIDEEGNPVEIDAADYVVTYGNDTVGYTTTPPTEAGNYVIVVTLNNTTDYAYATGRVWYNAGYNLVNLIDPEITFSFEAGQSFEYDGTGEAPNITVSVPEGVEYTWAYVDNGTPIGDGHTIPTTPGSYALDITTLANETYNSVHTWRVFHITAPVSEEVIKVEAVFENNTPYTEGHPTFTGFVDEEGNPVDVPETAYTINFESEGGYNSPEAPTEAGTFAMVVRLTDDAYAFANGKSYNQAVFQIVEA